MSRYHLIGLTGYAGTGKDTARAILEEHGFVGLAFADPIRQMLRELLTGNGIDDKYMDERELKEAVIPELGISYRHLAQTLGTEWGRSLASDFWLRLADAYMTSSSMERGTTHFVISDVRFANEAAWVRASGGVIWRIHRPAAAPVRAHASEAEVDLITPDQTIHNTGTLDELRGAIEAAIRTLT